MDLGMLIIVLVIVIPGYFMVRRMSGTLYSESLKIEEETEKRYGFQRQEEERIEKAKQEEKDETLDRADRHKRAKKKINRTTKKTDQSVVIKYRSYIKTEKLNKENIK